jgi:hypothetical protein
MADVNVRETGTYPAEHLLDDYFTDLPTDYRYTFVEYRRFNSHTAIDKDSNELQFILPPQNAPYCYQLGDSLMHVKLQIVKKGQNVLPDASAKVAPVDNIIGSLFSKVTLQINDDPVTTVPEFYPYKCYLKRLLTYNDDVKTTNFKVAGYCNDSYLSGDTEPSNNNNGWKERGRWFREDYADGANFRADGATFIGPFMHELSNISKDLPPGKKNIICIAAYIKGAIFL